MARDSKLMWTMGNFSRFVRPGAVRLDVEGITEIDGLMLSAYRNTDGTTAIVAINYGKTDRPVSISMKGSKRAAAYRTSDTEGENLKHIGTVNLKKNILPGRSVTTFVVGK
jgi:O-glycosyl hydrolase